MKDSYYRQKMMDSQEMEIERRRGKAVTEKQWQSDRILGGRYDVHYTEFRNNQTANYLNGNYRGRDRSMIVRFKCGNEEWGNK